MKSYSRRELYALGETLGDSSTIHKVGGGRIYGGGGSGGGSPGPSTTYSNTSNIPEYARPYVENMLQSAQTQVYNDDMTSFRPYTPYSSDVNNYFADFSPLQQSAYYYKPLVNMDWLLVYPVQPVFKDLVLQIKLTILAVKL